MFFGRGSAHNGRTTPIFRKTQLDHDINLPPKFYQDQIKTHGAMLGTDKQTDRQQPEVVWEQTNTCEKEHKELSWQKSRKLFCFFLPHVKDRTFWKLWEFCVTSSLDRFS